MVVPAFRSMRAAGQRGRVHGDRARMIRRAGRFVHVPGCQPVDGAPGDAAAPHSGCNTPAGLRPEDGWGRKRALSPRVAGR